MLGLGSGPLFIRDWAKAVGTFADVVGVTVTRKLPVDSRPLWRGAVITEVDDVPVVMLKRPRLPKGAFGWLSNRVVRTRILAAAQWLAAEHGPIDIIHSHFYSGAAAVPFVAARLGVPFVHTEHSSLLARDEPLSGVSPAGLRTMRKVFGDAARVFFVGSAQMEAVHRIGITGRFSVLPNPVDASVFEPTSRRPNDKLRLVTVGHLIPRKRHELLLEALSLLLAENRSVSLEIVGGGRAERELKDLARRLGVDGAVRFLGRVPRHHVADSLAKADLYVHTSEQESFGVSIVEALFSGLPIVTVRAGGVTADLPEHWGVVVDPPEPAILAQAIADLQLDSFDGDRIATEARARYGAEGVAFALRVAYREVLFPDQRQNPSPSVH
jgi:glycosyltransferase involved in cell wall biosynthesis